jgi:hypothetical protein
MNSANKNALLIVTVLVLVVAAKTAHAYIGPGVAFISYLFGPIAAAIAAVGMILYLPIKTFLRRCKNNRIDADKTREEEEKK